MHIYIHEGDSTAAAQGSSRRSVKYANTTCARTSKSMSPPPLSPFALSFSLSVSLSVSPSLSPCLSPSRARSRALSLALSLSLFLSCDLSRSLACSFACSLARLHTCSLSLALSLLNLLVLTHARKFALSSFQFLAFWLISVFFSLCSFYQSRLVAPSLFLSFNLPCIFPFS